jgi:FtsZ-interacting cell division protein ZipA
VENFWGTLSDWLVGIGTIALATVTFVGLVRERREKRRLQKELASRAAFDEFERRTVYDRERNGSEGPSRAGGRLV